ncbi:MAG: hypothetical protein JWQ09_3138 [Segetibacter sp.]|nr:hypothetical protein [Segetibacter sp.]
MKKEKTILAAYPRPYKTRIADSADTFLLMLNRIVGTRFTTIKKPLQLLKEMPALKIANKGFYANAKVNLKVNSKFEVASTEEILQRQAEFMNGLIEENKQLIKNRAEEKYNERLKKIEVRKRERKAPVVVDIRNLEEYIRSNRIILWVMLIPFFLTIIFFIILYFNN